MATFSAWHAMLWDKIQVDELVEDTRKMLRDLKTLNKAVRGYDVYRCAPVLPVGLTCAARNVKCASHAERIHGQDVGGGAEGDADIVAAGV